MDTLCPLMACVDLSSVAPSTVTGHHCVPSTGPVLCRGQSDPENSPVPCSSYCPRFAGEKMDTEQQRHLSIVSKGHSQDLNPGPADS